MTTLAAIAILVFGAWLVWKLYNKAFDWYDIHYPPEDDDDEVGLRL